jgi:hypothetical protein
MERERDVTRMMCQGIVAAKHRVLAHVLWAHFSSSSGYRRFIHETSAPRLARVLLVVKYLKGLVTNVHTAVPYIVPNKDHLLA